MKKYVVLIFFFSCVLGYSQQEKELEKDSIVLVNWTCEKGVEDAKSDFDKGLYKCYSYGLLAQITPHDEEFEHFLFEYRKKQYGIIAKNAGCVISEHSLCYSKEMTRWVHEKYGNDIFERSRKEAEKLYFKKK